MSNTESALEEKFRDKVLELRVVRYLCDNPSLCGSVEKVWLSIEVLREIWELLRGKKIPLTKEMLHHNFRTAGKYKTRKDGKGGAKPIYEDYIDKMFQIKLVGINEANIIELIKQLYDMYESRTICKLLIKVSENIRQEIFNVEDIKKDFKKISNRNFMGQDDFTGDYIEDYKKRRENIDKRKDEDGKGLVPTGITKLDYKIGGLMPGEFGVLAARSGLGKTAMMCAMAVHAWLAGYSVGFATGEMASELIQLRIDSNITGISGTKFRTGDLTSEEFKKWETMLESLKSSQESFLEVEDFTKKDKVFNTDNISDWLHRVQDKHSKKIDIIFVDYINIMTSISSKSDRNDWQSQAGVVWDFKDLVEGFNKNCGGLCAWSANQVKDDAYEKSKLSLIDLKYARAISETAPIVVGLVRTEDDILENTMQAQLLKIRNGEPMKDPIILYPQLDVMRIGNFAETKFKNILDI